MVNVVRNKEVIEKLKAEYPNLKVATLDVKEEEYWVDIDDGVIYLYVSKGTNLDYWRVRNLIEEALDAQAEWLEEMEEFDLGW